MVVMDEDNCMVDIAKFFLSFTQSESCGKCPPCRIGTYQMLQILEKITSGNGEEGDIEKLERLGKLVKTGSLCGLGQSAPNPALTTIRYFRDEYEEHVKDKYCRAKVCKGLGSYRIDSDKCFLCGLCKQACAYDAVVELKSSFYIDLDRCVECRACYDACPVDAVKIMSQRLVRLEEEFHIPLESIDIIERRCKLTLKDIIESKPLVIVTITKDCRVADAVRIMSERNVSGVFVTDENNKLAGIFTERDIVRCVVNNISLENETIQNIMRHDIIIFDPSMEISSAVAVASRKKIRHLPVLEGGKIVGMITFRDLVAFLLPDICYMAKDIY
jgi:NADH-quinone oxidoreductase subunit F/NADP-reducing hydrogenase subunit HndC